MATWNAAFLEQPKQTDTPTQGDDEIRALRAAIQERIDNEHLTYDVDGTGGAAGSDWVHRAGSAVAFYAATGSAPTVRGGGDALVNGMLWYDTTLGVLKVYTGSWTGISKDFARFTISGTMVTGTDIAPYIVFPRACTVTKVSARVKTCPTGGTALVIDVNKNANTGQSIFSGVTPITFAASEYSDIVTSFHATYSILAADDYLSVDIDTVGSTIAGADLSVTIEVTY